jgi:hypothetical protein
MRESAEEKAGVLGYLIMPFALAVFIVLALPDLELIYECRLATAA